jgi:hypothetical protein
MRFLSKEKIEIDLDIQLIDRDLYILDDFGINSSMKIWKKEIPDPDKSIKNRAGL